jgi:hypothetical protein
MHRFAFPLGLALGIASVTFAGDTVRPVLRPSDRDDVRRLDLQPADEDAAKTETTCWLRGGCCYGYYGPYFSYYAPVFPYYGYYFAPDYYFGTPVIVPYGAYYPALVDSNGARSPTRSESWRYDDSQTFRYDGGPEPAEPVERIPPARDLETETAPIPAPAGDLKLGPAPSERTIAQPARSTSQKRAYPAYGEDRLPLKQTPRDAKTLLIRGTR